MFDKNIWTEFWHTLQIDAADCLQKNILNFSTLLMVVKVYIEVCWPEHAKLINGAVDGYLLTLPTQISTIRENS